MFLLFLGSKDPSPIRNIGNLHHLHGSFSASSVKERHWTICQTHPLTDLSSGIHSPSTSNTNAAKKTSSQAQCHDSIPLLKPWPVMSIISLRSTSLTQALKLTRILTSKIPSPKTRLNQTTSSNKNTMRTTNYCSYRSFRHTQVTLTPRYPQRKSYILNSLTISARKTVSILRGVWFTVSNRLQPTFLFSPYKINHILSSHITFKKFIYSNHKTILPGPPGCQKRYQKTVLLVVTYGRLLYYHLPLSQLCTELN